LNPRTFHPTKAARFLVNKQAVLDQFLAALTADLATLTRAANGAFAAATDPDSKAENKYDTRTLEASYIARGQAKRVTELQEAVQAFGALSGGELETGSAAALGALVTLDGPDGVDHYLIGPCAGGTEIVHEGIAICIITPASALGQKLVSKRVGDVIAIRPGAELRITSVK
jgi:transcription elongation GreA/GreB family factor